METETDDRLWSVHDVCKYLGVPVGTLYQWRVRSEGPPALKLGRHLRYDRVAVREWAQGQGEAA